MKTEPKSSIYLVCISLILIGAIWAFNTSEARSTAAYPPQPYGYPYAPTPYPYAIQPSQSYNVNPGPEFDGFTLNFNTGNQQGAKGKITSFSLSKTNETVKVLGEFGNTGGKAQSIIEKKIEGAKKFRFNTVVWALKSWDNELLGVYVNDKPVLEFRYTFGKEVDTDPKKKINKCKSIKEKTNVQVKGFGWTSTAFRCVFKGEVTNDGKLMIGGKDVTSPRGPYVMDIGFKSTTNQPTSDESWAVQSIKVVSTGPSTTELAQNIPQPINIYVGMPVTDLNKPPQQQPTGNSQASPSTPSTEPVRGGEYDPRYYVPPQDNRRVVDTTAGYLTDDIMTGKADSMCANCLFGNPSMDEKQKEICRTQCVGLSKQKAQNILARYNALKDEYAKAQERIKALEGKKSDTKTADQTP